jgi:hypothetical protein
VDDCYSDFRSLSARQCLGCGTRLPDRTFAALDVDIPVALAISVSVTPASRVWDSAKIDGCLLTASGDGPDLRYGSSGRSSLGSSRSSSVCSSASVAEPFFSACSWTMMTRRSPQTGQRF